MDFEIIGRIAERKIQEAIEEGVFDDLPGKGKPLVLDDDPMTPAHLRMANKVLKNAGVLPDWMQVQKDIGTERQEIVNLRGRLVREYQKRRLGLENLPANHPTVTGFTAWHTKSRADYLRRIKSVNTLILKLSMMAPTTVQPPAPYRTNAEMAAFDEEFAPLPQSAELLPAAVPEPEGTLKRLARERYDTGGGTIGGWIKAARMLRSEPREQTAAHDDPTAEDIGRADAPRSQ